MALIDFALSNARRFHSSMGNPLGSKGLIDFATVSRLRLYCVLRDLRTLTHDMNDRFVLLVAQATK